MQSKYIKDLLLKKNLNNKNKNLKNSEMNFSDSNNEQNEIKAEEKEKDKTGFNYLLCSNNDTDNII